MTDSTLDTDIKRRNPNRYLFIYLFLTCDAMITAAESETSTYHHGWDKVKERTQICGAYITVSHSCHNEGKNRSVEAEMLLISQSFYYLPV